MIWDEPEPDKPDARTMRILRYFDDCYWALLAYGVPHRKAEGIVKDAIILAINDRYDEAIRKVTGHVTEKTS